MNQTNTVHCPKYENPFVIIRVHFVGNFRRHQREGKEMSITTTTSPPNPVLPPPQKPPRTGLPRRVIPQRLPKTNRPPQRLLHPNPYSRGPRHRSQHHEPTCDSLKLKKQLTTLHLQTASLNHASLALAKLVQLTDSKKPEVARRACMSLLKLAHLHNTKSIFPDDNEPFFPEDDGEEKGSNRSRVQGSKPQNPTPTSKPAVRDGGATPLPFQTSAFTLQPSPPSPFHRS